jgi:hypothetical protein
MIENASDTDLIAGRRCLLQTAVEDSENYNPGYQVKGSFAFVHAL